MTRAAQAFATTPPGPLPEPLAGTFVVDAHVHCYPGTAAATLLDHGARNLTAAAAAAGLRPAAAWLLFTETARDHVFAALQGGHRRLGNWILEATDEPVSLLARRPAAWPLVLVAGRQIVTAEGLEVLALAAPGPFADGQELAATVAAVQAAGGLAVLPWGFGKWWGRRGRILARFLRRAERGSVFLGDNGGRPRFAPPPRAFAQAAARGIFTLPGSDPLPLPAERTAAGRYAFALEGAVDPARPAAGLVRLLQRLEEPPRAVGRRQRLGPFLARQAALRLGRRTPRAGGDDLIPGRETARQSAARRDGGAA